VRYGHRTPPLDPKQLALFLAEELPRIQASINSLYDGVHENRVEAPDGDEPVLFYSDGSYDPGLGEGWYVRMTQSIYKVTLQPVEANLHPSAGEITVEGQTPTVS
jgi:hypothetical protein